MPEFRAKDFRFHGLAPSHRCHVIAALLVNYFLPRPRVVSLWEGFKGSFRKGSKV